MDAIAAPAVPAPEKPGTLSLGLDDAEMPAGALRPWIESGVAKPRRTNKTTEPGHVNKNNQMVLRKTLAFGNDHNQRVYAMKCGECGHEYGANGSDIWLRLCPSCQGGAKGLDY